MPANTYIWILSPLLYCICAGFFLFCFACILFTEKYCMMKYLKNKNNLLGYFAESGFFSISFEH